MANFGLINLWIILLFSLYMRYLTILFHFLNLLLKILLLVLSCWSTVFLKMSFILFNLFFSLLALYTLKAFWILFALLLAYWLYLLHLSKYLLRDDWPSTTTFFSKIILKIFFWLIFVFFLIPAFLNPSTAFLYNNLLMICFHLLWLDKSFPFSLAK